jgi:hypothetical protein
VVLIVFWTTVVFFLKYLGKITSTGKSNTINNFGDIEICGLNEVLGGFHPYVSYIIRDSPIE